MGVTHLAKKWTTLTHNGVAFPPPHVVKGLTISIGGQKLIMTPAQEEMAYAWAKKKDTPYVKDPIFAANFIADFAKQLGPGFEGITLDDVDFSDVYRYVDEEKFRKSILSKEEKKALALERKKTRESLKAKFGYAIVDGKVTEIANWMIEPPGIFMGRGDHPMRGRWKPRIGPQDVTLNIGSDAVIPEGAWGGIIHDPNCMWLARWVDKLTGKNKYVWLSDAASIKQTREKEKYDKARELARKIDSVRGYIERKLSSKDPKERELATVSYLIDVLAMRVGDEKDEDEADTVGASTLRVEHVALDDGLLVFNFLGKDSVRWHKALQVSRLNPEFVKNISILTQAKNPGDLIFGSTRSSQVNRFLGRAMPGLTAKVFRTFIASDVVRCHLPSLPDANTRPEWEKLYHAKMANLQAAMACNHKRTVPPSWEKSMMNKRERMRRILEKKPDNEKHLAKWEARLHKLKLDIELAEKTREYNLSTSLKNYIDPRIYKSWAEEVGLDWTRIYSKSLLKKFEWAKQSRLSWHQLCKEPSKTWFHLQHEEIIPLQEAMQPPSGKQS